MHTHIPPVFIEALKVARADGFLATNIKLVRVFEDGLSHNTALFYSTEKEFVLKSFKGRDQLSRQAIQAQVFTSRYELSPKVFYSNIEKGILVCEFINIPALGQVPNTERSNSQLLRVADSLSTLHNIEVSADIEALGHFDIVGFCSLYVDTASDAIKRQHELLLPSIIEFQKSTTRVFCHNDLVADNIFCLEKALSKNASPETDSTIFIDWEYAQLNDPWFDLAAVVFYLGLNQNSTELFLNQYFLKNADTKHNHPQRLLEATTVLLWGDVLWHLHNFGNDYQPKLSHKIEWLIQHASGLN